MYFNISYFLYIFSIFLFLFVLFLLCFFFLPFSYLMYFNIVKPLVCKTVTRLHLASFGRSSSLNENSLNS